MKKLLSTILILGTSLGLVSNALASASYHGRPDLCQVTLDALHHSGFNEGAAYSPGAIVSMLKRYDVSADLSQWNQNQLYQFTYSCSIENQVAHPQLTAVVPGAYPSTMGVIHWEVTRNR